MRHLDERCLVTDGFSAFPPDCLIVDLVGGKQADGGSGAIRQSLSSPCPVTVPDSSFNC